MKLGYCGLAALLLGACATTRQETASASPNAPAVIDSESGVVLGAVADAQIPAGKCGMILWTLDAQRPQPVLRFVAGEQGNISIGGAPAVLTLTGASGAAGFGVYEDQSFESPAGVKVEVKVQFGQGFDGGAYLHRGLITVEQPGGWRSVTPAAGLAGCRG